MRSRDGHAEMDQLVDAEGDLLAYTALPRSHWRSTWPTNPLERLNKEINRHSNVVGIFPSDQWQVAQHALPAP